MDCPYCGAPLEPIRWTDLALLAVILALAVAGRRLIEPLLDLRTVAVLAVLAIAHHIWTIRRLRKERREKDASGRLAGPDR